MSTRRPHVSLDTSQRKQKPKQKPSIRTKSNKKKRSKSMKEIQHTQKAMKSTKTKHLQQEKKKKVAKKKQKNETKIPQKKKKRKQNQIKLRKHQSKSKSMKLVINPKKKHRKKQMDRLTVHSIDKKKKKSYTDHDLWKDYIAKFGNPPQNIQYLQNFSKTKKNYKTLNYKETQIIFNKFNKNIAKRNDNKTQKMTLNRNVTKQRYLERDIQTAKRRWSQTKMKRMSIHSNTDLNTLHIVHEIESKNDIQPTMAQIDIFLESERLYVYDGLRVGYDTFFCRLQAHNELNQSIISDIDIQSIFGNYQIIYNVNSKLYDDLKELKLNKIDCIDKVIYKLGKEMVDFIPYFKMYTKYIVKKHAAVSYLEHLKHKNKAFNQFVKLNELCAKKKLKSLLEEPAHRIPQYLQYLVDIYASYKHESNTNANTKGGQLLLKAIADIKKVTDEIAMKCHDLRARLLVGTLQRDVFGNKIQLLSPHRFCIAHCSLEMLFHDKEKIKSYKLILCNDIYLISKFSSRFKYGQLVGVYPLIGLRISRNIIVNVALLAHKEYKCTLLPSNVIIMFCSEEKMEKWIQLLENAVDKQEHSFKQCNVVDLEKRVRRQKTSQEGRAETITITNTDRLKEIERWRKLTNKKYRDPLIPIIPCVSQAIVPSSDPIRKRKPNRSRTLPGIPKKEKKLWAKLASFGITDRDDSVSKTNTEKVRVMRDEEVLQFDEEIPLENFMKALNSGFVKITSDDEQNEQYKKAADKAKHLVRSSLENYRRYVTNDDDDDDDSDWDSSDSDDWE